MIDANSEKVGEKLSELWAAADGARERPVSTWWKNGECLLLLLEGGGCAPPALDAEPPDHEVTLAEMVEASRHLPPEREAAIEADRIRRSTLTYEESMAELRASGVKKDALRPAWAEFYRHVGMHEHADRMRSTTHRMHMERTE